jgi:hypothetical protein
MRRFYATDDAGASAKWYDGCAHIITPIEEGEDILFITWVSDNIWGVGKVAGEFAYRVAEGAAIAVQQALIGFSGTNRQQAGRNVEARRSQADFFFGGRRDYCKLAHVEQLCPPGF